MVPFHPQSLAMKYRFEKNVVKFVKFLEVFYFPIVITESF